MHVYLLCSKCLSCSPVILACRNTTRGESLKLALEADAKQHGNSKPQAEVMQLDVASLQSIRDFAQKWNQQQRPLYGLINNAGVFFMAGESTVAAAYANMSLLHLLIVRGGPSATV